MKLYFGRFERGKFVVSEVEATTTDTARCYQVERSSASNYSKTVRKADVDRTIGGAFTTSLLCADFYLGIAKRNFEAAKTDYEAVETWIRENER